MKNRILVFLVFITNILNAQSVDPETFPTVVGQIGSKNLYTNTGGEGKLSVQRIIDSVKITDTISMTYSQFYNTITNNNLQVGKFYILVDFQTVYDQMDFDNSGALKGTLVTKTGATEQIWVLALSSNQIADKAYSATFPNDEIQYDWTYNATFVNGSPAKGRISERIDEWNNRTDYDHREIKFIRYDDGAGNFTIINDNGNASQEFLTFGNTYATNTGEVIYNNYLGDFYSISGLFFGQEYSNNVINSTIAISINTTSTVFNNTFLDAEHFNAILNGFIYNNVFKDDVISSQISGECDNNIFNSNISGSKIDGQYRNNTSNNVVQSSIIYGTNENNIFESIFYSSIGGYNRDNTFEGIFNCEINAVTQNNQFNTGISNTKINGTLYGNIFNSSTFEIYNLFISGNISNKTIDDTTYPLLFGANYDLKLFQAQDGNVYFRYFDGTNDVNTLIP